MRAVAVGALCAVMLLVTTGAVFGQDDVEVYPDSEWCTMLLPEGGDVLYCVEKLKELVADPTARKVPESLTIELPAAPATPSDEWQAHITASMAIINARLSLLQDEPSEGLKGWRAAATMMSEWAVEERAWLDEHPVPEPCYQGDSETWTDRLSAFEDALALAEEGFEAFDEEVVKVSMMTALPALNSMAAVVENPSDCG